MSKLKALMKKNDDLCSEIEVEAKRKYPEGSAVSFKKGIMTKYKVAVVQGIHQCHGQIELRILNPATNAIYWIGYCFLHPKDQ